MTEKLRKWISYFRKEPFQFGIHVLYSCYKVVFRKYNLYFLLKLYSLNTYQ